MKLSATLALLSVLAIGSTRANAADPPSRVLAEFGLTGTWSAACYQPAGPRNPRFTYEQRPDGQVDNLGDFGEDGPTRATIREAFIDQDRRLHATTYTTFDNLPKLMRDEFEKAGLRPNVTNRSILVIGPDGGLNVDDNLAEIEGLTGTLHVVSNGHVVNPVTQAVGPRVSARFKCP